MITSCFNIIQPPSYKIFNTETKKDAVRNHIVKDFINNLHVDSYLADPNSIDNNILKSNGNNYCYG